MNYVVYKCAQVLKEPIFYGTEKECRRYCIDHDWVLVDENDFEWTLEIDQI